MIWYSPGDSDDDVDDNDGKKDDDNDDDNDDEEREGKLHGRQSCITCYETETNNFDPLAVSGVCDDNHHNLFSIIIVIVIKIVLVTLTKNTGVKSWRDLFKDKRKVTQMTLYATHQLVKSETIGWWSHLAPDLLTAAPKIAIKLSPKTPGVLLP